MNAKPYHASRRAAVAAALLLVCTVPAACTIAVQPHGHVSQTPVADAVQTGDSRDDVLQALGTPSSQSLFEQETWYYVNASRRQRAFYRPETIDRTVTEIRFNAAGLVEDTAVYALKDGEDISFSSRATPTEGHELGVIEQMLGNLGRFNKGQGPAQ